MPQNTRRYFEESENLLRGRTPESYGSEFAAVMRSKLGERFKHLASPEKLGLMSLIGDPRGSWNVAGVNFPTGLDNPKNERLMAEALEPVLEGGSMPKGKRIFGVGRGADAATYAHELRHDKVHDEVTNRMMDLIHGSTSLPAYKANIDKVYDYLSGFDFRKKFDPIEQKEAKVLDFFKRLANEEAQASGVGVSKRIFSGDWIKKNVELNKAGAVGGFLGQEKLPNSVIEFRAKLPFLNFVGRLGDGSVKKASGGMIENTTHYRKIL